VIRLVVANQRGGAGKTTTAVNCAWYLAAHRGRTLLIDADTQGSIGVLLGVQPARYLKDLVVDGAPLEECVIAGGKNLDILCGGKDSVEVESALAAVSAPELNLESHLEAAAGQYEAVVIDVSPAINLLQACAIMYAGNVLIPVGMDLLSLTGARAVCEMIRVLRQRAARVLRIVGLIPCQVDHRLTITKLVYDGLGSLSEQFQVPLLPGIRTDQNVHRAWQARMALLAYSPAAKAALDYVAAFEGVMKVIEGSRDEQTQTSKDAF
jgi:chromosome partitioning protein